jgi:hypothetical protein
MEKSKEEKPRKRNAPPPYSLERSSSRMALLSKFILVISAGLAPFGTCRCEDRPSKEKAEEAGGVESWHVHAREPRTFLAGMVV